MWLNFALALVCAAVLIVVAWGFKGRLLTPVKVGESTKITLEVFVDGSEPFLEQTLKSLVWLYENGTLKAEVVLHVAECDSAGIHIAQAYVLNYNFIKLDYGDN